MLKSVTGNFQYFIRKIGVKAKNMKVKQFSIKNTYNLLMITIQFNALKRLNIRLNK